MRSIVPCLVVVLACVVGGEEDRFGNLHLNMLTDIHKTLVEARTEKQLEHDKMMQERKKQREDLENERQKLQDDLRNDRKKQFEDINRSTMEQHEQFKGILNQIMATVATTEEKKLGFHHMALLHNISEALDDFKQDSLRHFEELHQGDIDHHEITKNRTLEDQENIIEERTNQFKELKQTKMNQDKELKSMFQTIMSLLDEAKDCLDLYKSGVRKSGTYVIKPEGVVKNFYVYCDMDTEGGGWTVIQRRGKYSDPPESFNRSWDEYKDGFGKLSQEFWLGNERISALTAQRQMVLKVQTVDVKKTSSVYTFNTFNVGSEVTKYKLTVSEYTGKANQFFTRSNGQTFSTQDKITSSEKNCAILNSSGWWFASGCDQSSNLNGAIEKATLGGMTWNGEQPLESCEMKIRSYEPKTDDKWF